MNRDLKSRTWSLWTHLAIALGFCHLFPVQAQEQSAAALPATERKLTLAEARRTAFERNWDLLAARSEVELAVAQKIVSREFPNPTLSLSTLKINTDGQPSHTVLGNDVWHRNYDSIAAINQLFEIGGKRSSRKASANAGFDAAKSRLMDARRILDAGVGRAYVAALLAQSNVEILKQSAASLRKEAQIAETRLKAGDISAADKSQIEVDADRLELDAKTAQGTATAARVAVEVLMGEMNPRGIWVPGDSLNELAVSSARATSLRPGTLRPDLAAATADLKKADADLRLQKAMRIPDPTALVQYEREPPDQPNTIGVGLSFPLPLWNQNKGAIKSAQATRDQAQIQLDRLRAQVAAEIVTSEIDFNNASERWDRYQNQIQPNSEKVRKSVAFAYEKGGASLVDLLTAQRTDNEIRLATAQAEADSAAAAITLTAARNVLSEIAREARNPDVPPKK